MAKDVLAVISSASATFSKGQKRIANYILENYDKAAFLTAGKLGTIAGVSESTVVRFAAELGYDGYPAMRKALQEMITNRLTSVQRIEVTRTMIGNENIPEAVLSSDIEKIRSTLDELDTTAFNKAADMIINAEHIYVIGTRSSTALSNYLGFYLNMLFPNVHIVNEGYASGIFEQIMRISPKDVLIAMSFPRYSKKTLSAIRFARDRDAGVVSITDSETSLAASLSSVYLLAKSNMLSFVDSLVAPMSLINALIVSIANKTEDDLLDRFSQLENIWSEYDIYENSDL